MMITHRGTQAVVGRLKFKPTLTLSAFIPKPEMESSRLKDSESPAEHWAWQISFRFIGGEPVVSDDFGSYPMIMMIVLQVSDLDATAVLQLSHQQRHTKHNGSMALGPESRFRFYYKKIRAGPHMGSGVEVL
jgi:hypothetical protein